MSVRDFRILKGMVLEIEKDSLAFFDGKLENARVLRIRFLEIMMQAQKLRSTVENAVAASEKIRAAVKLEKKKRRFGVENLPDENNTH